MGGRGERGGGYREGGGRARPVSWPRGWGRARVGALAALCRPLAAGRWLRRPIAHARVVIQPHHPPSRGVAAGEVAWAGQPAGRRAGGGSTAPPILVPASPPHCSPGTVPSASGTHAVWQQPLPILFGGGAQADWTGGAALLRQKGEAGALPAAEQPRPRQFTGPPLPLASHRPIPHPYPPITHRPGVCKQVWVRADGGRGGRLVAHGVCGGRGASEELLCGGGVARRALHPALAAPHCFFALALFF